MWEFAEDLKVDALLREATAHKGGNDWESALCVLAQAKALMLVSPVAYPAETWCKYPLYLQQAGRFEESMAEFQFLLDDLERRARKDARLDDPSVGPRARKLNFFKLLLKGDRKIIKAKRALAVARDKAHPRV